MTKEELNRLLRNAIENRNVDEVVRLLESGADPNFQLKEDLYEGMAEFQFQPYSPLRLVVFMISDSMIGDQELAKDAKIATLLLDHGANPKPAMQLAEYRYGEYDPTVEITPFGKSSRSSMTESDRQGAG